MMTALKIFFNLFFEHMRNCTLVMKKVPSCLKPDGKLFIHIFTHKEYAYLPGAFLKAIKF